MHYVCSRAQDIRALAARQHRSMFDIRKYKSFPFSVWVPMWMKIVPALTLIQRRDEGKPEMSARMIPLSAAVW